jgi:hypothetical protein
VKKPELKEPKKFIKIAERAKRGYWKFHKHDGSIRDKYKSNHINIKEKSPEEADQYAIRILQQLLSNLYFYFLRI